MVFKPTLGTVPVVSFQKNGTFSSETFLKRSGKLGDGSQGRLENGFEPLLMKNQC